MPKRFAQPEAIAQVFNFEFDAFLKEMIIKAPIDPSHVRLVNFELVPAEVRE